MDYDTFILLESLLGAGGLFCIGGIIYTGIRNHRKRHASPYNPDDLSPLPNGRQPFPKKKRTSWKEDYNAGHKAGREDALFRDSYGHAHGRDAGRSDAYRAGYQAGHEEEDL